MSFRRLLGFRRGDAVSMAPMGPPFLVAVFSVVGLAVENPDSGIRLQHLGVPLFLAVLVAHIAWVGSRSVTEDLARRSILSTALTLAFLYFGYFAQGARRLGDVLPFLSVHLVSGGMLLFGGGLLLAVIRTRRDLSPGVRFLNVTGVILIGMMGLRSISALSGSVPVQDQEVDLRFLHRGDLDPSERADTDPDIVYIILDSYTGPQSLETIYDLDISDFIEELESYGFVVPRRSRANYVLTLLSVSSMLDWGYVHGEMARAGNDRDALAIPFARLHDNSTTRFLRDRGYRVVFFRSTFPPMNASPTADIHVPRRLSVEFEILWFDLTLMPALIKGVCKLAPCGVEGFGFAAEPAAAYVARFQAIAALPPTEQPTFTIAHILLPHEPFLFDADCNSSRPFLPREVTPDNERKVRDAYRAQVTCLNRMVLPLVRDLTIGRDPTPVVILQSDHGFGRLGLRWSDSLADAEPERVQERLDIFAAYLLPRGGREEIYDSITPINAFRAIFRTQFDLDLPPVPDRSFWNSYEDILSFTPVPGL